jgi:hypothetical protein
MNEYSVEETAMEEECKDATSDRYAKEFEDEAKMIGSYIAESRMNDLINHLNNWHMRLPGNRIEGEDCKKYLDAICEGSKVSMRTIYRIIDYAMQELKIDVNYVRYLQGERRFSELFALTLPVYYFMRAQGFRHYPDLTS